MFKSFIPQNVNKCLRAFIPQNVSKCLGAFNPNWNQKLQSKKREMKFPVYICDLFCIPGIRVANYKSSFKSIHYNKIQKSMTL